jgi:squalene-associated FAD-dependent desaturase
VSRVIVVGAGAAGLAAATALAEAGREVLLLESTAAGGGRARSFVDRTTGDAIDNGQHALMGCYDAFLGLLARIGSRDALFESGLRIPLSDPEIADPRARMAWIDAPGLPAPLHFGAALLRYRHLSLRERVSALVAGQRLVNRFGRAGAADATVAEALSAFGQSPRARRALWDPIVWATLNADPARASARLLAAVVGRALLATREGSRFLLPAVPLSELYVEPARKYLESRGGSLRTRAPVDGVCVEDGRVLGVFVDGERIDAESVILAVPPAALRRLRVPGLFLDPALDRATPIVSVTLWLDRDPGGPPFLGLLGCETQWIFRVDQVHARSGNAGHRLACVRSGADAWDLMERSEIAEIVIRDARRALPGMADAVVRHHLVVTEHAATLAPDPVLQPLRPGAITSVRSLFLAGDWIDTGLPATLESAALSGHRAAELVLGART